MSGAYTPNFLQSTDSLCWKEAIESNSYGRLKRKRSRFAEILVKILHMLHRQSKAIDIFVQADPSVAGIIWGSIRVLLQITEDEERASRVAGEGVMEILGHMSRWEQATTISDILDSGIVRKAVIFLYTKVLDFLVSSTTWLERSSLGCLERLAVSVFVVKAEKFEEKLNRMRGASDLVDREIQTRGSTMDKIDEIIEQIGQLSQLELLPVLITGRIFDIMQNTRDVSRLKQWLSLAATKTLSSPQTDGTCIWILRHPHFLKWKDDIEHPMLWVQGLPGRGKSVMASFLHKHLETKGRKTLFYRFQRSASEIGSTTTVLAASIIDQLLESPRVSQISGIIVELDKLSKESPLGPQHCPFQVMWTIAMSLLLSTPRFHLIIDALDECKFDGPILPGINAFLEHILEAARKANGKILIFSRPDPQFSIARKRGLLMRMTEDEVASDVLTFARNEYERLQLPNREEEVVLERIRSSSHGSFWWSRLFLDYLGRSLQTTEFLERLRGLPPSIEEFYRSVLLNPPLRLRENEVESQRTLKTAEIEDALPLVNTEVREFFESCERTNDISLGFSFSDSHALLAEKCLTTLLNEKYANKENVKQYLHVNYDEENGSFYHYASRYCPTLLRRANEFLLNLQFAFWAEYSRKEFGQFIGNSNVSKILADIDSCFATSYRKLKMYQWLARLRLCDYYLDLGISNEEPNHPVVLRATATTAYARFHTGRMRAAWRIYAELTESRREVVGENDLRFVEALHFRGEIFAKTSTEFLRLRGLGGGLYLAAQLEASLGVLQTAMQKRRSLIRIAMADVLRAVDIAREIVLAKTFLEANMIQDARIMVEEIEMVGSKGLRRHFKRFCQVHHVKGLLLAKEGMVTEAINCLQGILTEAEQDQNNRALLWVRLDLAMLLRERNDEGDEYQASANFDNIVRDVSGNSEPGFLDEPDPPRLLDLAEKALSLVRCGHWGKARLLLNSEHIDWNRPSDLWLWVSDIFSTDLIDIL
ncbi:hypothetical protein F5Y02DRAFT_411112 [Annulohypoxylon stygium]|nr:hypothetical protein F5Y02DRAFT_411112 [Annulohypoxylon stygium]